MRKKALMMLVVFFVAAAMVAPCAYSKGEKIGYVDLRKAFYEYEKTKNLETELNDLTQSRQTERTKKIEAITKMRDEAQLLKGEAQAKKQAEIEKELAALQEYDRETRQSLLNRKNDMFREVIDDIQKIVEEMGTKGGYDYVLDSRNIMYANPDYDMTEEVIKKLNK